MAQKSAVEKVVSEAEDLPKAIVRRVVKEKLSQLSKDGGDISVFKEALQAFSESARIFIHYLSAMANDICKESKRQTINAEDVFKALEEMEFPEFVGPLKASLEEFRQKNAGKRSASKAKEANNNKKKKESAVENGGEKDKQDKRVALKTKKANNNKKKQSAVENGVGKKQDEGDANMNGDENYVENGGAEDKQDDGDANMNGDENGGAEDKQDEGDANMIGDENGGADDKQDEEGANMNGDENDSPDNN